jgi:GNAT superfamily N-acetyltransferase
MKQPIKLTMKDISRIDEFAETFIDSFFDYELIKFLFPDEHSRRKNLSHFYKYYIKYGILYGEIYASSDDNECLSMWFLSSKADIGIFKSIRSGGLRMLFKLGLRTYLRFNEADALIRKTKKNNCNQKHWYLAHIGVKREFQGKGFAGKMIKTILDQKIIDDKIPCYLETFREKNVEFYEHLGFKLLGNSLLKDVPSGLKFP